ncbi:MAG: hypothetical protein D3924_15540 [Candidatus Electrothrix sp. AR4]|nr:hypothetical protein [Candidatus Electrothrix sp. AR4]
MPSYEFLDIQKYHYILALCCKIVLCRHRHPGHGFVQRAGADFLKIFSHFNNSEVFLGKCRKYQVRALADKIPIVFLISVRTYLEAFREANGAN